MQYPALGKGSQYLNEPWLPASREKIYNMTCEESRTIKKNHIASKTQSLEKISDSKFMISDACHGLVWKDPKIKKIYEYHQELPHLPGEAVQEHNHFESKSTYGWKASKNSWNKMIKEESINTSSMQNKPRITPQFDIIAFLYTNNQSRQVPLCSIYRDNLGVIKKITASGN